MATTADDVWQLLGELTEAQTETERQLQATKQLLQLALGFCLGFG
jgi:hypothetical protein